ncbi:hypothetical protein H5410_022142 [Solanum commersonii]|uniref:Uncharacterized protein n=1 Tax=Solanum commersonii TaxID=4109 RepID=A0A9J5ZEK1_SOLCO|nr:hypothetical protein H5410_022142 [Solanum commersonii]
MERVTCEIAEVERRTQKVDLAKAIVIAKSVEVDGKIEITKGKRAKVDKLIAIALSKKNDEASNIGKILEG